MTTKISANRRKARVRRAIKLSANGRCRLSVFRSSKNIYAQLIDDASGKTLVSSSTLDQTIRKTLKVASNVGAAIVVGKLLADKALSIGIKNVVFDRGSYMYHGRVKALAEAAREGGLSF